MSNNGRPAKEQGQEATFSQKITDFIRKYRTAFLATLGAVLLALVVVAAWSWIHSSSVKASTAKLEKVSDDIAAMSEEQDQAKKAELEKAVSADLEAIVKKWPRLYAGQKAHVLRARLAVEKKDWPQAEEEWLAAADAKASSYLAPVAIQGAAIAAEERGAPDKAVEYYKRLVEKYPSVAGVAHGYFSLGRLAEESKDYANALTYYEKVVSLFPDDDWTKLSKDRIISLKSRGLVK